MTEKSPLSGWAAALAWLHAAIFLAVAALCYLAPEALFGDAAWLQMTRLAVGLLAAALVSLSVVLIGTVRSGSHLPLRLALWATLVFDVQAPILLSLHPVVFEYVERDLGIPWFLPSLALVALVSVTVLGLSTLRQRDA